MGDGIETCAFAGCGGKGSTDAMIPAFGDRLPEHRQVCREHVDSLHRQDAARHFLSFLQARKMVQATAQQASQDHEAWRARKRSTEQLRNSLTACAVALDAFELAGQRVTMSLGDLEDPEAKAAAAEASRWLEDIESRVSRIQVLVQSLP